MTPREIALRRVQEEIQKYDPELPPELFNSLSYFELCKRIGLSWPPRIEYPKKCITLRCGCRITVNDYSRRGDW